MGPTVETVLSKDKGGGEEPLIARVQLRGKPVITFS